MSRAWSKLSGPLPGELSPIRDWLLVPGLIAIVAVSAWLSVIDIREHLLPNRLVGPLAGGVAI